jgi:uncharacterized protein with FMN-binding domain
MQRSVPFAVVATAGLVGPLGVPLAAIAQAADVPAAVHAAAAGKEYTGATSSMRWGSVIVHIWVKGRKITDVRGTLPTDRPRSKQISNRAGPALRQEVLRAQSANIRTLSGATMTSRSYIQSLRSALSKAHL